MKKVNFFLLITLIVLLGVGAFCGGGAMILDPSGISLKIPLSLLEYSPFTDFLIPGIILFCLFGLIPLLLIRPLLKNSYSRFFEGLNVLSDMHWAWTFVIYISFGLIIWIQLQMEILREVHWVHTLYTFWAISILALALLPGIRSRYKK